MLLIAGFLGSGKTTFVIDMAQKLVAEGKKVAILVNEIGEIGIDGQLMRQLDMNVWELMGGCVCCTLAASLPETLEQVQRDYTPDMVILEPSGSAETHKVLSALSGVEIIKPEDCRTVILVDVPRLPMLREIIMPLISSQIAKADYIALNKMDARHFPGNRGGQGLCPGAQCLCSDFSLLRQGRYSSGMDKGDCAMTEMNLEPFAAKIRFTTTAPVSSGQWAEAVRELMEGIGNGCNASGPCLVGHVKCLTSFETEGFIRASLVNPAAPPDVENSAPEGAMSAELILNVLVYGLERARISAIVQEALGSPVFSGMEIRATPL